MSPTPEPGAIQVDVSVRPGQAEPSGMALIVRETLAAEGVELGTVDLIVVGEQEMADMNAEFMAATGSTDVLSFPMDDPTEEPFGGQVPHIGDIVLCVEVAERQAPDHSGDFDTEIALLLIHSVLHLLGHDHYDKDETELMRQRERANLSRYSMVHPIPESVR